MAVAPGMMSQMLAKLTQANSAAGGMSALGALGQGMSQLGAQQQQMNSGQMAAQLAQQMPPPPINVGARGGSSGVGAVLPQQMQMLSKRPGMGDLGLVG